MLEEDGRSRVAAFNRPIEVVPLVHPPERRGGLLAIVEMGDRLAERDAPKQREGSVQDAAIARTRHDELSVEGSGPGGSRKVAQPEAIGAVEIRNNRCRKGAANLVASAKHDRVDIDGAFSRSRGPRSQDVGRPRTHQATIEH